MRNLIFFLSVLSVLFTSCIQSTPPNPEADILTFYFPEGSQRIKNVEIYNKYIVAYPKKRCLVARLRFHLERDSQCHLGTNR